MVKWGEVLYCHKCHKRSPENFVNCAYCGAKLKPEKKKQPSAFIKKERFKLKISFRTVVRALMGFAVVLAVAAIFTATVTGSKPEKVVRNFTRSIQAQDEKLFYSLYDDGIKDYKKENRYYGEEETFENMVIPMGESHEFYKEKCGEDYKLTYSITSFETFSDEELAVFNEMLEKSFSYIKLPARVDLLNVEITAKGEKGEYKSIYNDFLCLKIKGKWYKADKTVYTEYEKIKTTDL